VLLSPQYNNYADAVAAIMPAPPTELQNISIFCGRMVVRQGISNPLLTESSFNSVLSSAGITNHNDLLSIQGGADNDYYHLTAGEYARLQTWSASWASSSVSSSYSDRSLTASYAENASGFTLQSGSFYPITSSWSVSASWAPGSGTSETSSYSLYALTASYVANIPSGSTESASYALTASYAKNIGGLSIPTYDYSNIVYSGPNGQIGTCTYKVGGISGSIVAEITAIYNGPLFIGVSKSLG
jgi:hypothetical protein